jgi:hypothetical protein
MKQRSLYPALLAVAVLFSVCFGQIEISHETGVGSKALGMGNNFVALANDQSALFWNPAGLGFIPAREFQVGIDGLSQRSQTSFFGNDESSVMQRLRVSNLGYLHAFPTSQGGFSIAAAFQSPITFDDARKFSGSYYDPSQQTVFVGRDEKTYGSLNFWTAGFGLQVAKGFGIGASASLVTGDENRREAFYRDTNGILGDSMFSDDYDRTTTRSYVGYDVRFGLLYNFVKHFSVGARFVLPQTIWFSEDASETNPDLSGSDVYTYPQARGKIFSSYSGAVGFSGSYPFLTASAELRIRAPYSFVSPNEDFPASSLADKTIFGAGIGLEAPIVTSAVLLRAGYSWDQFDTHLFASQYDDPKIPANWDPLGEAPNKDVQAITAGVAFIMKTACLEIGYGYSFWGLETNDVLTEDHSQQRVSASLSFRF